MVYCSGAVPMDPKTMQLIPGDVQPHTVRLFHLVRLSVLSDFCCLQHQCIKNLTAILEAAGSSKDKVVKVNVFLSDMGDFAAVRAALFLIAVDADRFGPDERGVHPILGRCKAVPDVCRPALLLSVRLTVRIPEGA